MFRPYNPSVLIGNWYEDRVLEDDIIKDYLEKRNTGNLISQKIESNLLNTAPQSLTTVNDGRAHFGDTILVRCEGTDNKPSPLIARAYRKDCFLSTTTLEKNISTVPSTGSSVPVLNEKSGLVLQSVDGSPVGSTLKFGQPFAISTFDKSFYLHSDLRTYEKAAKNSRLQIVDFVSVYNHECDWVASCYNPKFRLETEGTDVPANEKILIIHMKTNKTLAVVTDFNNSVKFEIVAHNFLNSHKAEEDNCHWQLVTNLPQIDIPTTSESR